MNISSILAITTFLAIVANVRGDGSAALQPDPTGQGQATGDGS